MYLLKKIVMNSQTAYFVTDQYIDRSIKSLERKRHAQSGIVRMRIKRRDQLRPKQWSKYLRDSSNKEKLVSFLLRDWQSNRFVPLMRGKTLFVNSSSSFFKLSCAEEIVSSNELVFRYWF